MAIATEFQHQLDRLNAFVKALEGSATGQSAADIAALEAALTAAGAPPAVIAPPA